jgi:hypothetical protein
MFNSFEQQREFKIKNKDWMDNVSQWSDVSHDIHGLLFL